MRLSDLHRRVSVQPLTDPDYQAVLNYATSQGYALPSAGQQTLQNQLVKNLKTIGAWDKLDTFYCFATDGSEDYSYLNWIDPTKHKCTVINGGSIFKPNLGTRGSGVATQYLETNYNPNTQRIKYELNNSSIYVFISEVAVINTVSSPTSNGNQINGWRTLNETLKRINQGFNNLNSAFNHTNTASIQGINRTSSTDVVCYLNKTRGDRTATSSAISNGSQKINAWNINNSSADYTIGMHLMGSNLVTENDDLVDTWNAYFNAL
jgi:hypothetical protein